MAHVTHYKQSDIRRLQNEYLRSDEYTCRDGRIDSNRTQLNYRMRTSELSLFDKIQKRLEHVSHSNRKDLNVMSTWIITCPKKLVGTNQQSKFFDFVFDFAKSRYGDENVLDGFVHLDETTPHIHIPLVPVSENRVSAKALFTRKELKAFQFDLEKAATQVFGSEGLILNGRTKGHLSVKELKARSEAEKLLKAEQNALTLSRMALSEERDKLLAENEKSLKTQIRALQIRSKMLDEREEQLNKREDAVLERENTVSQKEKGINKGDMKATEHRISRHIETVGLDEDEDPEDILEWLHR